MKYEIVKYNPEFKSQVVKLQKHMWGRNIAVNTAYLEWKYERNPYMERPLIYLALNGNNVVGMRGVYGAKWQINRPSQTFIGPCGGDSVIAPEHRNRGLFAKIMEAAAADLAESNYTYVFNLSASLVTQITSLTTGWRSLNTLEIARFQKLRTRGFYYASRLPLVSKYTNRLWARSVAKRPPFYCLDTKMGHEARGHIYVEQASRPHDMAELVKKLGNDGRIQHVRDEAYFAWRFQNPRSDYRFLFSGYPELEGYLVLQRRAHRRHRVNIVDWEATNSRLRHDLLQTAMEWGEFDDVTTWTATLPSEVKTLLRNAGFNILDKSESVGGTYNADGHRRTVLVKAVRQDMQKDTDWVIGNRQLLDLDNWDLRMIYSDAY
jgi:hypothetical protein